MKKCVVWFIVILIMALCLSACRNDKKEANSEDISETKMDVLSETAEAEADANDEEIYQKEEQETGEKPTQDEEDEPLIIVPEGEAVGGGDLG